MQKLRSVDCIILFYLADGTESPYFPSLNGAVPFKNLKSSSHLLRP